jgi:hypothetical protein
MPSDSSSDFKLEIGHVLFIDIVGYSKLLINEQSEQLEKLKEIVRGTEQFRRAEAEGKPMHAVIRIYDEAGERACHPAAF